MRTWHVSYSNDVCLTCGMIAGFGDANLENIVVLIMTNWEDPADDEKMKDATNKLGKLIQDEARKLNLLANFTYLNYANKDQSVYEQSLTPEDLARMLKVRDEYDPSAIFRTLWKGGYKLPETLVDKDVPRDEL